MRMKNNFGLIINIFLISISFSQGPCILSEVYVSEAANRGDPDDYIEVYNNGSEECTLAGFQLDDSEELEDFTFGNVILSAGDYWIGYEDSTDSFNSGLGSDGDIVVFANSDGDILTITLEESIETEGGINANCYDFNVCLLGDLNGDGYWNVLDVVQLSNCVLENNCDQYENSCAGDLNGDGYWNILDIVILTNCILGNNCEDRVN